MKRFLTAFFGLFWLLLGALSTAVLLQRDNNKWYHYLLLIPFLMSAFRGAKLIDKSIE